MKKVFFQLHWFLGITAGLVITIVGFTGGMLSLQPQILQWMNPGVITVNAESAALSPSTLKTAIERQMPEEVIIGLTLMADPELAAQVQFAPEPGQRRGERLYVNPYSGQVLGQAEGREFFINVMRLHRWLLAGDAGKQIVGASTIILIFLALTGIYLRWPKGKNKFRLKYWLTLRFTSINRAFWWKLHAVVGTWLLPVYLLASLTGLYWSYDWYRDALFTISGVERSQRPDRSHQKPLPEISASALDAAWASFVDQAPEYASATMRFPVTDTVKFSYLSNSSPHERATNQLELNVATGDVEMRQLYANKQLNQKLMGSMLPLHSGSYFGWPGLIIVMVASLAMPLFFITGWYLYLSRKKARQKLQYKRDLKYQ